MNEELQKRDQVIEDMQAQLEALKAQIKPKRQVAATADAE
jgi:hypothetical protein